MNSLLFRRYRDIASALQDFLMGGEVIGRLIAVATARASPVVHGYGFSENELETLADCIAVSPVDAYLYCIMKPDYGTQGLPKVQPVEEVIVHTGATFSSFGQPSNEDVIFIYWHSDSKQYVHGFGRAARAVHGRGYSEMNNELLANPKSEIVKYYRTTMDGFHLLTSVGAKLAKAETSGGTSETKTTVCGNAILWKRPIQIESSLYIRSVYDCEKSGNTIYIR